MSSATIHSVRSCEIHLHHLLLKLSFSVHCVEAPPPLHSHLYAAGLHCAWLNTRANCLTPMWSDVQILRNCLSASGKRKYSLGPNEPSAPGADASLSIFAKALAWVQSPRTIPSVASTARHKDDKLGLQRGICLSNKLSTGFSCLYSWKAAHRSSTLLLQGWRMSAFFTPRDLCKPFRSAPSSYSKHFEGFSSLCCNPPPQKPN